MHQSGIPASPPHQPAEATLLTITLTLSHLQQHGLLAEGVERYEAGLGRGPAVLCLCGLRAKEGGMDGYGTGEHDKIVLACKRAM